MEKNNGAVSTASSAAKTPTKKPIASIDGKDDRASANGADKHVTLSVHCKITLRRGEVLFGGAEYGGGKIGEADKGLTDLILEVEGTADLGGGTTKFGGAEDGGGKIGHPDVVVNGAETPRQLHPARASKGRRNGGAKAS